MSNFNNFVEVCEEGIKELAVQHTKNFALKAIDDAKESMEKSKKNYQRWTEQLNQKKLSKEDFEWLVKSKKDVLEMHALKEAGLAKVEIDKFKNAFLDLVVKKAFATFL